MKRIVLSYIFILLGCLAAAAWDNSTMNPDYRLLTEGKFFTAVMTTYTEAFGGGVKGQIFYLLLPAIPYIMLWMSSKNIFIPNALLLVFVFLYGVYIPSVGWPIIVLLIAFGVVSTLVRIFSPVVPD